MAVAIVVGCVACVVAVIVAARVAATASRRDAARAVADAKDAARASVDGARREAESAHRAADAAARAELLDARQAADDAFAADEARLAARADRADGIARELAADASALDARDDELAAVHRELQSKTDRAAGVARDADKRLAAVRAELEARAGVRGDELAGELARRWLDDARARATAAVRAVDAAAADPANDREARRVMEIAGARCSMHFLTERSLSNLKVGPDIVAVLLDNGAALHAALERVAGVRLLVNDERDAVRLDGLDGVGREVVRRALHKFAKKPESIGEARKDADAWATRARENLMGEIRALGKKAFAVLGVPRAHPEIVELVGALNFRTSYTQNQWLHAVESSFLAGMMAAELGLDEKLARRATLMHDIGKALTHKIEGSHAVIGADIARRHNEPEVVANAIGAHHTDEPFNSVYAYLVAASDAMSGARPGARRELAEGFTAKIEDLERIGLQRRGVSHAHAVHGGRELRVYVRERDVDDLAVVEMSSEIAAQIADEMTFPGQIKVTVIRAFEATATAN
jgi:ribonuclease Y